jgi:hypothetical protein
VLTGKAGSRRALPRHHEHQPYDGESAPRRSHRRRGGDLVLFGVKLGPGLALTLVLVFAISIRLAMAVSEYAAIV